MIILPVQNIICLVSMTGKNNLKSNLIFYGFGIGKIPIPIFIIGGKIYINRHIQTGKLPLIKYYTQKVDLLSVFPVTYFL